MQSENTSLLSRIFGKIMTARLFLEASVLTLRINRSLKSPNFETLYSKLDVKLGSRPPRFIGPAALIDQVIWSVRKSQRLFPFRTLCLEESTVIHYLLCRHGVSNSLCIGVSRFPFRSHAWVERDGKILNDAEHECRSLTVVVRKDPETARKAA